jgi:translation initiation factor 3 subunit M
MPGPVNTLLIDGSFEELSDELAQYIDEIKKRQGEEGTVQAEISPLLKQGQKDEVLKKLVLGSSVLNAAPEKGLTHFSGGIA